ncbi:MAG: sulfotransferase [Myxococcota bacterium]
MTATPLALRTLRFALAAVEREPTSAAAWFGAGRALLGVGEMREAVAALQKAVAIQPRHGPAWRELGVIVAQLGWVQEPITCFRNAVAAAPRDADARVLLAQALLAAGELDAAEAVVREALAQRKGHPDGVATLGRILSRRDRADEGLAMVDDALSVGSTPGLALARAEISAKARRPADAIPALRKAVAEATDMDRVRLLHALGDALDASRAYEEAWAAYREANDSRTAPVDPAAILADAQARATEPPGTLAGPPLKRMLWIVGLPRSGTSLLEQILAAHPQVAAGGERSILPDLEGARAQGIPVATLAASLRRSVDEVSPTATWVTDKLPDNLRRLGLAAQIAPACTVIYVKRDPIDALWSCYRQCFGDGLAWTTRMEGLVAAWQAHRVLVDHWRETLPQSGVGWIEVRYEDLVGRSEFEIRKLLLALNLPVDPACFTPDRVDREIATASALQVRQPLHRDWVGRAAPYRAHLAPLIEAVAATPDPG